jgi:N-acetyl-gamma-glutamyl-phosphate reductase
MKKIKAGIIGAAGYTGGELIRLLLNHPGVEVAFAHSNSSTGKFIYEVHTDMVGDTQLKFSNRLDEADVLFLCMGHGESRKFMSENAIPSNTKVVDLSQDFRLQETHESFGRNFVYGLPELNRKDICYTDNVANPGCFATAIQLGLLPLAQAGRLTSVHTTGITGATGAGQSFAGTSHFSWRSNNIQAYKTLTHQHLSEIGASLTQLSGDTHQIHFIPWRGDFARGIYTSSMVDCDISIDELYSLYEAYYSYAPFTHVSKSMIDLKQVVNTNKCLIHLEKEGDKLVIHSAIDNLLKGASGQAIQNMNLMFGLPELSGLQLKANAF